MTKIIACGIDQGLANLGYAFIEYDIDTNQYMKLDTGTLKTKSSELLEDRLLTIYEMIKTYNLKYNTDIIACEKLFYNPKQKNDNRNKSASIMTTNMVTGVVFLVAGELGLWIKDFVPGTVKKHVAGYGRATKEDLQKAIEDFCEQHGIKAKTNHETDAIGIALTAIKAYIEEFVKKGA
ncbi:MULTISPECIES: crossover junction endodeoxyribonuclease RuvC [Bacillus]|uniref:Crossover junction endodeoxyribonuclease RuvC n=3 Tax=Bacillus cereus group TaxID=86661 RepID=A0A9X6VDW7_BACTU|nr:MULTISPECIES: crossover junction endodeoxyribonuclease RuvC [Bacillus]AFV21344.1 crossover junction endodeoxyribonuclease RuvC [Bacillus thuringiensis Bt407]ERI01480.1 Holliday junction resolvase [Bacillus thuringiensis T01-328]MBN6708200.1 crossover junction endodeoxyribonuclease RuvC [Bacillus thuringiensis]MCU5281702.1 crossover junction endodeoxyribonuclease RuvC [Bacillus cereus]MDF9599556.1 crossover junction endodeoxyribonuclease RuvC [Bacillus cereus]